MTITTRKETTGEFTVLKDGQETGYRIVNGSRGVSGKDSRNMYGIVSPSGRVTWVGALASCKALVARNLA